MTTEYFTGSLSALNDRLTTILAGPATTIHQVVTGKPGEFVIIYS